MRRGLVIIALMLVLGGCTARQATTNTVVFIAAGAAACVGVDVDPYAFSSMAEGASEMTFEAAEAAKQAKAEKEAKEANEAAGLTAKD